MSGTVWVISGVILLILEVVLPIFVFLWLGAAAVGVAILTFLGITHGIEQQFIAYAIISPLLLWSSRKLIKSRTKARARTNIDDLIGKQATVIQPIEDVAPGRISLYGIDWLARSANETAIPAQSRVCIIAVEGATLVVVPATLAR